MRHEDVRDRAPRQRGEDPLEGEQGGREGPRGVGGVARGAAGGQAVVRQAARRAGVVEPEERPRRQPDGPRRQPARRAVVAGGAERPLHVAGRGLALRPPLLSRRPGAGGTEQSTV
jgi:hypothetical protein